jgi:hypothetical protein
VLLPKKPVLPKHQAGLGTSFKMDFLIASSRFTLRRAPTPEARAHLSTFVTVML